MARTVRRHPDFLADLEAQVFWLRRNREPDRIERLRHEIDEATRAVARFPKMGLSVSRAGSPPTTAAEGLRKLVLRRTPFVIWYATADTEVWLLRLFHLRQKQPRAKLPGRPRARAAGGPATVRRDRRPAGPRKTRPPNP